MSPEDFKKARNSLGLTQAELGRRINETRIRVGRFERGEATRYRQTIPPDVAAKLDSLTGRGK